MKTRTVILKSFEDEMTGELGYALKGMDTSSEYINASMGTGIAHDLLEHLNGPASIGDIADEMEALGAIWYVRGQFGVLNKKGYGRAYTITQNLASDVVRMFRDHVDGQQFVDYGAPCTRALRDGSDCDLLQVMLDADADYQTEFEPECRAEAHAAWPKYRAECLNRMRIGYRKAARKYPDADAVHALFWKIEETVDKHGKPEAEGMEYKLTYRTEPAPGVWLEENYEEDYS